MSAVACATESTFRITGPGRYVSRLGDVYTVAYHTADPKRPWTGSTDNGCGSDWTDDGHYFVDGRKFGGDLVARIPDELSHEEAIVYAKENRLTRRQLLDEKLRLENEVDDCRALIATYRDKALWKLILTAYGNAPFGTDKQAVLDDAKAMLRTMEGGDINGRRADR